MKQGARWLVLAVVTCMTAGVAAHAMRAKRELPRTFVAWSAACPIEVEDPARAAPIVWRDCEGMRDCREMVADWAHEGSAFGVTPRFHFESERTGPVLVFSRLALRREAESEKEWIVAPADGPVRFAMRQRFFGEPSCTLVEEGAGASEVGFVARGDGESPLRSSSTDGLVVVAAGDATPRVAFRNTDAEVSAWSMSGDGDGFVRVVAPAGRTELRRRDGTLARVLHDPRDDPDGLPAAGNPPLSMRGRVIFEVGRERSRAVMAFDRERGVTPLLRWPLPDEHGAGNVGTDGEWLVWTEGQGAAKGGGYARARVMAARLGPDGALPDAHVAAEDPNRTIGASPFVVGCGRAAHETPEGPLVVELNRRVSWSPPPREGFTWGRPIGLTCDELWVTTFRGSEANVARVRLPRRE